MQHFSINAKEKEKESKNVRVVKDTMQLMVMVILLDKNMNLALHGKITSITAKIKNLKNVI